jgi:hypothetical protein
VCEEKESMELVRLAVFWEGNGGADGRVMDGADGEMYEEAEREREEKEWEKDVVNALESLKSVQVADGWVLFYGARTCAGVLMYVQTPIGPCVPFFAAAYHTESHCATVGVICWRASRWLIFQVVV